MSTRAAGRPRVAGSTALVPAVAKGRRLDEVLRAGAAVVGTPVAYGLATQQDKRLTRSLKDASLGDATGAPCVPLSFDPDYCKRFDKFYALGLAVTTSVASFGIGTVATYSAKALHKHIEQKFETECRDESWTSYIEGLTAAYPATDGRAGYGGYAKTTEFCNDLRRAFAAPSMQNRAEHGSPWPTVHGLYGAGQAGQIVPTLPAIATLGSLMRMKEYLFGIPSDSPPTLEPPPGMPSYAYTLVAPIGMLAEIVKMVILGATQTGYALYTGNYRGLRADPEDPGMFEAALVAAGIKLVASKVDEFARRSSVADRLPFAIAAMGKMRRLYDDFVAIAPDVGRAFETKRRASAWKFAPPSVS